MRRFIQKHRKWAVDERCQCGHPKAQHGGLDMEVRGQVAHQDGLGKCGAPGCECAKFRRAGWVFEGEQQSE
jgi:hypothetical protein